MIPLMVRAAAGAKTLLLAITFLAACKGTSNSSGPAEDTSAADTDTGSILADGTKCAPGYTCWPDPAGNVVWVMKDDGNVNGPTCKDVCEAALSENCDYRACDAGRSVVYPDIESFAPVAEGLGFDCIEGGCWWPDAPAEGLYLVSINTNEAGEKTCFFPTETELSCASHPGNANCFGERYASVCPCVPEPLDEACEWDCPPHHTTRATWKTSGTSCVERINYWRKRACEEGWVECPPAGLPPMVECTACHECANSEAQHDSENGAHDSFGRCGEHVQGEGGGATCADVIDSFVSERAPDENGIMRCEGHCGPIVSPGCQTFFWGKAQDSNFHTLNWRSCNADTCQGYCDENPGDCFTHETSPDMTCDDPDEGAEPGPDLSECE
jgi:hypothetical protein